MNLKKCPFYLNNEQEKWVYDTLKTLSYEEKIHQLFCLLGDIYNEEELDNLVSKGIGAVLFRPVRTSSEIKNNYLHLDKCFRVPLLHAANLEEGGAGGAIDMTYFSSQLGIAASNDINDSTAFAYTCANQGIECGYNWTFSPVSDIDMNYLNPITNCRTYGSDVEKIKKITLNYVKNIQKFEMASCAKHFPGDGVDFRDQHLHPSYNNLSAKEWRNTYGEIYKNLIDNGILSIMAGHIVCKEMEKEYQPNLNEIDALPGSMSKTMLTDVLRGELGFNGLICTDATIMGGYTMALKREEAIPKSIASGIDMIVFTTNIYEDINFIKKAVEKGTLTKERIDEAVTRILALKAKVCVEHKTIKIDAPKLAKKAALNSITLVKNNSSILPINNEKYSNIKLALLGDDNTFDGSLINLLKKELNRRGFVVNVYNPLDDDLHGVENLSSKQLTLIVLNYPPASNQTTVRVSWCPKHALEIPRFVNEEDYIFVSFANPYHLIDIPRTKVYINAYTATKATIEAVVEKICGESEFTGTNPIDPFCKLIDTHF